MQGILIIDDDIELTEMLVEYLNLEGVSVIKTRGCNMSSIFLGFTNARFMISCFVFHTVSTNMNSDMFSCAENHGNGAIAK